MGQQEDKYLKEISSPSELRRVLSFEVPRERVEEEIEQIIKDIRKELALPGFRKGKAPLELVRARFSETAKKEAFEKLIPLAYQRALERENLDPVLPGEISGMEYGSEGPLRFQIAIELYPRVVVKDYKGVKVTKEVKDVEDGDIEAEVENLRQRFATFEKMEKEAEPGDVVIIDYWRVGSDGKPIRGSKVSNYPVEIGSGSVVKDFNDALVGMKAGEEKMVEVLYPDDFPNEDLRGKRANFGIELKAVGRRIVPEANQEFAKMFGAESMEDLRSKIGESLEKSNEQEAQAKAKRQIMNTIVTESEFDVPDGAVELALQSLMKSYREEYGLDQEVDEEKLKEIKERLRPLAINIVKEQFIIVEIARREGIKVKDDDINLIARSIAERAGLSVDEVMKRARESDEIGRWRQDIIRQKVLDFLYEHAEAEE